MAFPKKKEGIPQKGRLLERPIMNQKYMIAKMQTGESTPESVCWGYGKHIF